MAFLTETVTAVKHWNDTLFSFKTTRPTSFRFKNGHFIMIGLEVDGRPLMRAYSIASANYEPELEFFSIKVPDGPLTSRLQHLKVGDKVLLSERSTGTLVTDNLLPGKRLFLLSTGTGLAPFLSIIKDPDIYEQFDQLILTHGVRWLSELAYKEEITTDLPNNEFIGELVKEKLHYYPHVSREAFEHTGRITDLLTTGKLVEDLQLGKLNVETDRFMLCGGPSMLKDVSAILESFGFSAGSTRQQAEYVVEKAFTET